MPATSLDERVKQLEHRANENFSEIQRRLDELLKFQERTKMNFLEVERKLIGFEQALEHKFPFKPGKELDELREHLEEKIKSLEDIIMLLEVEVVKAKERAPALPEFSIAPKVPTEFEDRVRTLEEKFKALEKLKVKVPVELAHHEPRLKAIEDSIHATQQSLREEINRLEGAIASKAVTEPLAEHYVRRLGEQMIELRRSLEKAEMLKREILAKEKSFILRHDLEEFEARMRAESERMHEVIDRLTAVEKSLDTRLLDIEEKLGTSLKNFQHAFKKEVEEHVKAYATIEATFQKDLDLHRQAFDKKSAELEAKLRSEINSHHRELENKLADHKEAVEKNIAHHQQILEKVVMDEVQALNKRIAERQQKLDETLSETQKSIEKSFAHSQQVLEKAIMEEKQALDRQVTQHQQELESRVGKLQKSLSGLEKAMESRISSYHHEFGAKLSNIEKNLTDNQQKLDAAMDELRRNVEAFQQGVEGKIVSHHHELSARLSSVEKRMESAFLGHQREFDEKLEDVVQKLHKEFEGHIRALERKGAELLSEFEKQRRAFDTQVAEMESVLKAEFDTHKRSFDTKIVDLEERVAKVAAETAMNEAKKDVDRAISMHRNEISAFMDRINGIERNLESKATSIVTKELAAFAEAIDKKFPDLVTRSDFASWSRTIAERVQAIEAPDVRPLAERIDRLELRLNELTALFREVATRLPIVIE